MGATAWRVAEPIAKFSREMSAKRMVDILIAGVRTRT
jgi:hypothetical protein